MNYINNSLIQISDYIKKSKNKKTIIFSDGEDSLIYSIAKKLINEKYVKRVILLVDEKSKNFEDKKESNIQYICPKDEINKLDLETLFSIRKGKDSKDKISEDFKKREFYATYLINKKYADCWVGGLNTSTKNVLLPAIKYLRNSEKNTLCTSLFLILNNNNTYLFSDCAVNINPGSSELVSIVQNAYNFSKLCNMYKKPNIAMLSFSSFGSGDKIVNKPILDALEQLKTMSIFNESNIVGEIQFDAAFSKRVLEKKCKNPLILNNIKNQFDIFIFPNLFSGNIGYKIAQYMGNYQAIGPIILGLKNSVCDLSRGANESDIFITSLYAIRMCY